MDRNTLDSGWFARNVPRKASSLLWEITDACNLRCLHCESAAGRRRPDELAPDEALALARQIARMGWSSVSVTGGEPLLRKDWADLARTLASGGCHVTLVTNGMLLHGEAIRRAIDAGVRSVAVSLDGLEQTHDRIRPGPGRSQGSSFQAAVRSLRDAKRAGLGTAAITHVNRWNWPELRPMHELLTEAAADIWQVQLGVPLGRLREMDEPYLLEVSKLGELEAFCAEMIALHREDPTRPSVKVVHTIGYYGKHERELRGGSPENPKFFVGCLGGWRTLGITSDGRVKPCAMLPRSFEVGDLREETLEAIWGDADRFEYQSRWDQRSLEGYCRRCEYRCICRAGCTSMAFGLTGSIYNNSYCLHRQARLRTDR